MAGPVTMLTMETSRTKEYFPDHALFDPVFASGVAITLLTKYLLSVIL